jgi:hypothetical protein
MKRTTPPLQVRGDVLRAWTALGTPSEVCRRLGGAHGRALVNTVRDWATLHGYLVQRPPMGLQLTATGLRWIAELDAGLDPDARRRTSYEPPAEIVEKETVPKLATVKRGSIPDRVLRYLNRHGSECNSELARVLRLPVRRVRNAARTLQLGQLVTATPERRTVESAVCTREAVVMVYRCTEAGREALKEAK